VAVRVARDRIEQQGRPPDRFHRDVRDRPDLGFRVRALDAAQLPGLIDLPDPGLEIQVHGQRRS
jgi:hypothetical protein